MTMTVRCVDCGFLSKRVRHNGIFRAHEGYFEIEPSERQKPLESFGFVPADTNALQPGEYACYRRMADFRTEIGETSGTTGRDDAALRALNRERSCAAWCRYEPGIDPAGHLEELKTLALEQDRRRFEETLAQFQARLAGHEQRQNKRLALIAIGVTAVLGIVQLLAAVLSMTPESIGSPAVRWVADSISAVARWLSR